MRSCEEFELLASLAVDEEATLEELAELMEHFETCPDCRAYYEDIKRIHVSFAQEDVVVPEHFSAHVMDRVRAMDQDRPAEKEKSVPFPRWRQWAALAACCAVAVLSVWAVGNLSGTREAVVTTDEAPRVAAQDARSMPDASSVQSGDADSIEGEESVLGGEVSPPLPDEPEDLVKTAPKDGSGEGAYQPLRDEQFGADVEDDALSVGAAMSFPGDALVTGGSGQNRADAPVNREDTFDDSGNAGEPEHAADGAQDSETPLSAPAEQPEEAEYMEEAPEVEPVEVIGVPEPGILIAFGDAAQDWVENIQGLEWSDGGSYPLTAEQYGDLLRALDAAGEPYRIEPSENYCLMTE